MRLDRAQAVALVLGALAALPALAHKGHTPSPPPTTAPAPGATAAPEAVPPAPAAEAPAEPITVPFRDAVISHMHNKVVHFPLALGMGAALLLLLSVRWPQFEPAARLLLALAALGAVAAYFSGEAQEEAFEDGPLRLYVERHELLGKITGGTLWAGVALGFVRRARPWLWVYALLLIGLLSATGFLGGILSHTEV
jgi:uncharacterized membrane protein